MITNNGLRFLTLVFLGKSVPSNYSADENGVMLKTPNGTISKAIAQFGSMITDTFPLSVTSGISNDDQNTQTGTAFTKVGHLLVGSGTTAPTRDDYKLENCLTQFEKQSTTESIELGKLTVSCVFRNTGEATTINELGYFKPFGTTVTSASFDAYSILIMRKVLDTPIQVEAGETFSISYTFDFTTMTD